MSEQTVWSILRLRSWESLSRSQNSPELGGSLLCSQVCLWFLSCAILIQSTFWRHFWILSSICAYVSEIVSSFRFSYQNVVSCSHFHICASFPVVPCLSALLNLIALVFVEEHKLRSSSFCTFLRSPVPHLTRGIRAGVDAVKGEVVTELN
jgi:hypothetical protein